MHPLLRTAVVQIILAGSVLSCAYDEVPEPPSYSAVRAAQSRPVATPPPAEASGSVSQSATVDPDAPLHVSGDVVPPVVIERVAPDYTQTRPIRAAGLPIFEAIIGIDGRVKDVRVVKSVHSEVDAAIVAALKQWKFKPATLHGRPVPVYFRVTVNIHWQ
jgi:TonB family protein